MSHSFWCRWHLQIQAAGTLPRALRLVQYNSWCRARHSSENNRTNAGSYRIQDVGFSSCHQLGRLNRCWDPMAASSLILKSLRQFLWLQLAMSTCTVYVGYWFFPPPLARAFKFHDNARQIQGQNYICKMDKAVLLFPTKIPVAAFRVLWLFCFCGISDLRYRIPKKKSFLVSLNHL